jgi:hypothetical protein
MRYVLVLLVAVNALGVMPACSEESEPGVSLASLDKYTVGSTHNGAEHAGFRSKRKAHWTAGTIATLDLQSARSATEADQSWATAARAHRPSLCLRTVGHRAETAQTKNGVCATQLPAR